MNGSRLCENCPDGYFQPQDAPATSCSKCPIGYTQTLMGESFCARDKGIKPEDCKDVEYWHPQVEDSNGAIKPGCKKCPDGGYCVGATREDDVRVRFGWSRCPNLNLTFERCIFRAACNGAPNPALENKYAFDENGRDVAMVDHNESCSAAYKEGSLLCAACAETFSPSGLGDGCDKCPSLKANIAFAIVGALAGLAGLIIFVRMTISDEGKINERDGAKNIGMSYIQMISLLITYPIAWPSIFVSIFQIGGSIAVMGQHLVNVKCAAPHTSDADVFYVSRFLWAMLPGIVLVCTFGSWFVISKCRNELLPRSKISASIVSVLFLLWPTLCSETFALFSCRNVCAKTLLRVDLNEPCWGETRHGYIALFLGGPMLLLYVIGLPLFALFHVWRIQREAHERGADIEKLDGHKTWGLFYSACEFGLWLLLLLLWLLYRCCCC
jgi:hypothetical protein